MFPMGMFAQSCSDTFSGTTFQPKSGITDTYYDVDMTKFTDPSSENLSVSMKFKAAAPSALTSGTYSVNKTDGLVIHCSEEGEYPFFSYTLTDLITTSGRNGYKVVIEFSAKEQQNCSTSREGWNKYIKVKCSPRADDEYKTINFGSSYTYSYTFNASSPKQTFSFSSNYSNGCGLLYVKSIKVTGCIDKKIVSENGSKVCAGEENIMIAKGLNGTCKWEISKDNKQTWEVIEGATESVITVAITDECYFRCTCGSDVLVSDVIRPVVCCSVAGTREDVMKVDFSSNSLNGSNRVDFGQLNDEKSQGITSTYTYTSSGNVDENGYIITTLPKNGGYWSDSAIKDHTTGGTDSHNGFLLVNCGKEDKRMFEYQISSGDFCKNTVYDFSAYIANIDANTASNHEPVNAGFQVYGVAPRKQDVLLLETETGDLPYTGDWIEKGESFNSGEYTTFKLIIKNNHVSQSTGAVIGNDIGIDDITFSTCSPEVKIYTDSKYTTQDTIVCDDGKSVHLRLEAHAVYDLSTFFKTPYFLFQTSTDLSSWDNVLEFATTDDFVEIDVEKTSLYESGLWYRVWVGGDKDAVEKSAGDGKPGTGCGKLTAVAEPILIKYQCKCSPTTAPTVNNYSECPATVAPYTKPLKELVTSQHDKLRFYEFQEGGTDLGEGATFDATVVGTKTYYVTNQKATDSDGTEYCESPRTPINIEIKDAAVFDVTPASIEKCFNDETPDSELTFTASKAEYDYTWTGSSISATGTSYTLERKASSGTITVVAKDPQGKVCDASKDVTYKISPAPEFTITSPSMVCVSNPEAEITVKLTSGSGHYVLTKNGATLDEGDMSLGQTDVIIKDNVVATSKGKVSYKFSIVNSLGCENSKDFEIAVSDKVEIPLVPTAPVVNNTICLGDKFDINAAYTFGAGESLNWYIDGVQVQGESGLTLTEQAPIKDTEYTVDLIGGQCEGSGALSIKVKQVANPDISTDKEIICVGTTINITDSDVDDAETYIWYSSTERDVWNVMTGETGKNITDFAPTVTASYKKVSKNGSCEAESNVVTVEVQPAIEFTIEPIDKKICKNQEVTLKMSGYPEGAALQWKEKVSGTELSTEATAVVKPLETTVYIATVTSVCEASKELTITVLSELNPTISPDVAVCEGGSTTLTVDGVGITSVQWSPATGLSSTTEKTVTASPAVTTEYTATISNGVCSDEAKVTVSVSSTPHFDKVNEVVGESCATRGVMVEGKGGVPPYSYSTDGVTYSPESTLIGLKSGYTMLYIMDSFTCKSDTTINLAPYAINPDKFFTPNDDGNNDLWQVENLSCYEGYIVEIFDRYGRRLYIYKKGSFSGGSVKDDFPGWDGYYNGHQMPSTDYWYLITVEEIRKQYNGHFTLKR